MLFFMVAGINDIISILEGCEEFWDFIWWILEVVIYDHAIVSLGVLQAGEYRVLLATIR